MREKSQADRLFDLLSDGQKHSTIEILEKVYGGGHLGLARVSARILDVKKKYNVTITGEHDPERPTIYWYQLQEGQLSFFTKDEAPVKPKFTYPS